MASKSSGGCDFGANCDVNTVHCLKDCVKSTHNHLRYLGANCKDIDVPESHLILCRASVQMITTSPTENNLQRPQRLPWIILEKT
jgi:hypothetical protein